MQKNTNFPPIRHIEKAVPPPEKDGRFPVERETKIKYIGTRAEFETQMEALSAELAEKTRMIEDLRYEAGAGFKPGEKKEAKRSMFQNPEGLVEQEKIISALSLLGFGVRETPNGFELICPQDLYNKTVRIRNDGGVWIFTAKARLEKLDENGFIEEKPEVEFELRDAEGLKNLFEEDLGLNLESHRQKLRTSYRLKTGQLVELNESPVFESHNVPFWIEIEGKDMADIENGARQLGFNKSHFFKGSDKQFLMLNGGLSEKETKNVLF